MRLLPMYVKALVTSLCQLLCCSFQSPLHLNLPGFWVGLFILQQQQAHYKREEQFGQHASPLYVEPPARHSSPWSDALPRILDLPFQMICLPCCQRQSPAAWFWFCGFANWWNSSTCTTAERAQNTGVNDILSLWSRKIVPIAFVSRAISNCLVPLVLNLFLWQSNKNCFVLHFGNKIEITNQKIENRSCGHLFMEIVNVGKHDMTLNKLRQRVMSQEATF